MNLTIEEVNNKLKNLNRVNIGEFRNIKMQENISKLLNSDNQCIVTQIDMILVNCQKCYDTISILKCSNVVNFNETIDTIKNLETELNSNLEKIESIIIDDNQYS